MTRLTFFKSSGRYLGYKCSGHSGYADAGSDVVCAAVSAATQLTAAYLVRFHAEDVVYKSDENSATAELKCKRPFDEADRQLSVLESFAKSIASEYSDNFIYDYTEE